MKRALLAAIGFYQRRISPLFGPRCRFQPSCSAYARKAVETHGACKGLLLSIGRILRCNPLSAKPGQYNPVPPPGRWRQVLDKPVRPTHPTSRESETMER